MRRIRGGGIVGRSRQSRMMPENTQPLDSPALDYGASPVLKYKDAESDSWIAASRPGSQPETRPSGELSAASSVPLRKRWHTVGMAMSQEIGVAGPSPRHSTGTSPSWKVPLTSQDLTSSRGCAVAPVTSSASPSCSLEGLQLKSSECSMDRRLYLRSSQADNLSDRSQLVRPLVSLCTSGQNVGTSHWTETVSGAISQTSSGVQDRGKDPEVAQTIMQLNQVGDRARVTEAKGATSKRLRDVSCESHRRPKKVRMGKLCPVKGCGIRNSDVKKHVKFNHLPEPFWVRGVRPKILVERAQWIHWLASRVQGGDGSLRRLIILLNRSGVKYVENGMDHQQADNLRALARANGWPVTPAPSINPLNSKMSLGDWRSLAAAISLLSEADADRFYSGEREADNPPPRSDLSSTSWLPHEAVAPPLSKAVPSVLNEIIPSPLQSKITYLGEAVDCHFYLDYLLNKLGIPLNTPLYMVRSLVQVPPMEDEVDLHGGVASFCNPSMFPSLMMINDLRAVHVRSTVGIHPKLLRELTPAHYQFMLSLWASGQVVGCGEFGLDRTCHPDEWLKQEDLVEELLPRVPTNKILVLHSQGTPEDRVNVEPSLRLLAICRKACLPREQRIQLHSWEGSVDVTQQWLDAFPHTYFSVNSRVKDFDGDQLAGLKCIPSHRLLLETYSPYFAPKGFRCGIPFLIGYTARVVARALGVTPSRLLLCTKENAFALFVEYPNQTGHATLQRSGRI